MDVYRSGSVAAHTVGMALAVEQWDDRVEWRFVSPRSMTVGALFNELTGASSIRRQRLYRFATWPAIQADLRLDQTVGGTHAPTAAELPRAAATA